MKIEKVNHWFAGLGRYILSLRWGILALFALVFALGVVGIKRMYLTSSSESYFLEDDPVLKKTDEFKAIFGNDAYVAVLTTSDNIFSASNLSLIRQLSNELRDSLSYAEKVTSLTDIEYMTGTEDGMQIEQIVPEDIPSDPHALAAIRAKAYAKQNVAERLISRDGRQSWILVKLRPFPADSVWMKESGARSPEAVTGDELRKIVTKSEYTALHPRGTGMPYINREKNRWIGGELPRVMGIATLLATLVLIIMTRSVRGVVVPLITAVGSIVIVYGALGFLRYKIDSSMLLVPMLLAFAVAIAYNIHIYSFFRRRFCTHGERKRAVVETIEEMGWPILFSALTTFVALLSFLVVPVLPLHFVGIATSSGVLLTFFITLTVMPAVLSFGKDKKVKEGEQIAEGEGFLDRMLQRLAEHTVLRHGKGILIASFLITGFFAYGFTRIETAFDVEKTMGRGIPYVKNMLEVGESELGSVYSYDIMIEYPEKEAGKVKSPEVLRALDSLSTYLHHYPLTKRTTSVLNILKDLRQTTNGGDPHYYAVPETNDEAAQLLLLYENAGGTESEYWIDYDYRRLRTMVELKTYNSAEVERELAEAKVHAEQLFPGATVTMVGSMPQFTAMMQYVVRGQISSFLISLLIIGVLMMLVFGSVRIGLVGLIPNIMPALIVGGLMGWMGYPLDMMTATIMPMILGLAVDDTIHFINHSHLEYDRHGSYRRAILRSFRTIGTPIVMTSVVIAANFSVYMTSVANTFFNMGLLSVVGVLTALLADLFITPVLIRQFRLFGKEDKQVSSKH